MNDITELKAHIRPHVRGQRVQDHEDVLRRIDSDDGAAPGSWVTEWCRVGERLEAKRDHLGASRYYAMARYPYVDGPAREEALHRCVQAFDKWQADQVTIDRLSVDSDSGRIHCWTSGLAPGNRKPLLIFLGGNMTVKEQWAPMLLHAQRLGMAAIVTEMPSSGENTLPYGPNSWQMFTRILDEVADRADVGQTYVMALSFSGHMALRCAVTDPRINGVFTVGAPISEFFTDAEWQRQLPRITLDTLSHMTGRSNGVAGVDGWALTSEQLQALDVPIAYVTCLRDEVIPREDVQMLKDHVHRLSLLENDDVHGAPNHVTETQLWTTRALLRAQGGRNHLTTALGLLLGTVRLRRRLRGRR